MTIGSVYKQLFKGIFHAFRSFFVLVHGPERVTVHPPPIKVCDQVFLLTRSLPISEVNAIKKMSDGLPVFSNGRH